MNFKKIITASFLALSFTGVVPFLASAATVAEIQAQLNVLMAQLSVLQNSSATANCAWTRDLHVGLRGDDVTCLQNYLSAQGFLKVSPTGYFGALTQAATKGWQAAHNVSSTGYFGTLSRGAYASLTVGGTVVTPMPVPVYPPQASPTPPPVVATPSPAPMCAQVMYQCSDGSYVGYIPGTCQYQACPTPPVTPPGSGITSSIVNAPTNRVRMAVDDVALLNIAADSSYQLLLQQVKLTLSGTAISGVSGAAVDLIDPSTGMAFGNASTQNCNAVSSSCTVTFALSYIISAGTTKQIKIRVNSSLFANGASVSDGMSITLATADALTISDGVTNNIPALSVTMVPFTVANVSYE